MKNKLSWFIATRKKQYYASGINSLYRETRYPTY